MKWKGRRASSNVDDRRGQRSGGGGGSLVGGLLGGRSLGCGGIILVLVISFVFGVNPLQFLSGGVEPATTTQPTNTNANNDELGNFVKVVLKYTEDVWGEQFPKQLNAQYQEPILVLFSGSTQSGCGYASAQTGPFYCPADEKVYIDLSFYQTMRDRFGASGDFAMAYVIAHEVGHHIQKILGITQQVQSQRGRISEADYNALSTRLELQADFLAGVWAHHIQKTQNVLEEGDIEEAMRAAHVMGDDHIQMRSRGYVVPESFTHGTSEQRKKWFMLGFKTGDLSQGDTFNAYNL